ncbi:mechanosensitive ion channel family protein [Candidatus Nanohalobium constans]|uniref:Small-conductance mechanosensitive channel n=1 Tax=Candidatus Nanohalobium constans TaxID=2565781 RepID=A0A5Q0UFC8_9ARCH|nr:mechanosensitive ion channel family protein [Candidatus Nanohalobium constans]QGA80266.1 small-conductance mechanosensitive channel [Candidatus Nanohalobium constans]
MTISILESQLANLGIEIQMTTLLTGALVLIGGWFANKISNKLVEQGINRRGGDKHAIIAAQKVTAYIIYPLTFVVFLGVFGLPAASIGGAVGLIGLGLSFALKDMIANFISGILILIGQPFKVGDQIKVSGEEGTVQDIKIRATDIKTYDGRKVIVPNSQLYNGTVINNTAYDQRRFEVIVGVGYDDDIDSATELAMESLEEAEMVEETPEPQVLVNELGGSSVNLKLRGWTKPSKANMVKAASEVTQGVKEKYDENEIDIPYPIRTVYMNNEDE